MKINIKFDHSKDFIQDAILINDKSLYEIRGVSDVEFLFEVLESIYTNLDKKYTLRKLCDVIMRARINDVQKMQLLILAGWREGYYAEQHNNTDLIRSVEEVLEGITEKHNLTKKSQVLEMYTNISLRQCRKEQALLLLCFALERLERKEFELKNKDNV